MTVHVFPNVDPTGFLQDEIRTLSRFKQSFFISEVVSRLVVVVASSAFSALSMVYHIAALSKLPLAILNDTIGWIPTGKKHFLRDFMPGGFSLVDIAVHVYKIFMSAFGIVFTPLLGAVTPTGNLAVMQAFGLVRGTKEKASSVVQRREGVRAETLIDDDAEPVTPKKKSKQGLGKQQRVSFAASGEISKAPEAGEPFVDPHAPDAPPPPPSDLLADPSNLSFAASGEISKAPEAGEPFVDPHAPDAPPPPPSDLLADPSNLFRGIKIAGASPRPLSPQDNLNKLLKDGAEALRKQVDGDTPAKPTRPRGAGDSGRHPSGGSISFRPLDPDLVARASKTDQSTKNRNNLTMHADEFRDPEPGEDAAAAAVPAPVVAAAPAKFAIPKPAPKPGVVPPETSAPAAGAQAAIPAAPDLVVAAAAQAKVTISKPAVPATSKPAPAKAAAAASQVSAPGVPATAARPKSEATPKSAHGRPSAEMTAMIAALSKGFAGQSLAGQG